MFTLESSYGFKILKYDSKTIASRGDNISLPLFIHSDYGLRVVKVGSDIWEYTINGVHNYDYITSRYPAVDMDNEDDYQKILKIHQSLNYRHEQAMLRIYDGSGISNVMTNIRTIIKHNVEDGVLVINVICKNALYCHRCEFNITDEYADKIRYGNADPKQIFNSYLHNVALPSNMRVKNARKF